MIEEAARIHRARDKHNFCTVRTFQTKVEGEIPLLPRAGEYTGGVLQEGIATLLRRLRRGRCSRRSRRSGPTRAWALRSPSSAIMFMVGNRPSAQDVQKDQFLVPKTRAAAKLVRCTLATMSAVTHLRRSEPFNLGNTNVGYGVGGASASPLSGQNGKRPVAVIGDGGLWHSGLISSVGHQVFNKTDSVLLVVDNGYAAATGGQDVLSSSGDIATRSTQHPIEKAVRGVGVNWVKHVTRTYDVTAMRDALLEALRTKADGPKVVIASSGVHAEQAAKREAAGA